MVSCSKLKGFYQNTCPIIKKDNLADEIFAKVIFSRFSRIKQTNIRSYIKQKSLLFKEKGFKCYTSL